MTFGVPHVCFDPPALWNLLARIETIRLITTKGKESDKDLVWSEKKLYLQWLSCTHK